MYAAIAFYVALFGLLTAGNAQSFQRFMLISTPQFGRIWSVPVGWNGSALSDKPSLLIDGLGTPQGLAVDQPRNRVIVADPALKQILSFPLARNSSGDLVKAGNRTVLASGTEARWVAVNSEGDIFFTQEAANQVLWLSYAKTQVNDTKADVLYNTTDNVAAPGGIATNNFKLLWTNKMNTATAGSLVQASVLGNSSTLTTLSKVSPKSYGACIANNKAYYMSQTQSIYGIMLAGGSVVQVADSLQKPRGCVYDGDGLLYVADSGAGTVVSFPGNMQVLR